MKNAKLRLSENQTTRINALFRGMNEHGVAVIAVPFNGSGDEGTTESPQFIDLEGKDCARQAVQNSLARESDLLAEEILLSNYGSWGDGPGSTGTIQFKAAACTIHAELGWYVESTQDDSRQTVIGGPPAQGGGR